MRCRVRVDGRHVIRSWLTLVSGQRRFLRCIALGCNERSWCLLSPQLIEVEVFCSLPGPCQVIFQFTSGYSSWICSSFTLSIPQFPTMADVNLIPYTHVIHYNANIHPPPHKILLRIIYDAERPNQKFFACHCPFTHSCTIRATSIPTAQKCKTKNPEKTSTYNSPVHNRNPCLCHATHRNHRASNRKIDMHHITHNLCICIFVLTWQ